MEKAIHMAVLYLSARYSVNVVSFHRQTEKFYLPGFRISEHENRVIQQMLLTAPPFHICFVKDRLFAEYCFAFVEDQVVFIGPFRTRRLYKSQLPPKPVLTETERNQYIEQFRSFPEIKIDDIRLGIHILFTGLYGAADMVTESSIDMREKFPENLWEEEFGAERERIRKQSAFGNLDAQLMLHIRSGNYEGAVRTFRRVMNNRGQTFILINTIEGLTSVRVLAQIAMGEAGVSATSASQVLTDFKLHGRAVTNITEARKLSEQLLQNSCRLVRENMTRNYSPAVKTAVDYIHYRLTEPLSLPAIAAEAGMTPNSLTTKFHAEVGLTPTAYITKCRLENAARLLENTQMGIQEICTRTGILDANYFSRCFRRQYGCSPTQYRKTRQ